MAKIYTKNEIQRIVTEAYRMGVQDGRNRSGDSLTPPSVEAVVHHPLTGSNHPSNYAHPGRGRVRRPSEPPPVLR